MGGKRISEELKKQIRYLSGVLHKSERFIVEELGVPKTTVHTVIAQSRLFRQRRQTNVQVQRKGIENDREFKKDEVWRPAISEVGSTTSYPKSFRERVDINSSHYPQPFEQLNVTAIHLMLRVLQNIPEIPPREIEMFLNLFELDIQGLITNRGRLARMLSDGFGPVAGAVAFNDFIVFLPRLLGMRVVEYNRLRSTVQPGESMTFSTQMRR